MSDGSSIQEVRTTGSVYVNRNGQGLEDCGVRLLAWEPGEGRATALRMVESPLGVLVNTFMSGDTTPSFTTLVPWGNVRCANYQANYSYGRKESHAMSHDSSEHPVGPKSIHAVPPVDGQQKVGRSVQAVMEEASGAAEAQRRDTANKREAVLEKGKALGEAAAEVDARQKERDAEAANGPQSTEKPTPGQPTQQAQPRPRKGK